MNASRARRRLPSNTLKIYSNFELKIFSRHVFDRNFATPSPFFANESAFDSSNVEETMQKTVCQKCKAVDIEMNTETFGGNLAGRSLLGFF